MNSRIAVKQLKYLEKLVRGRNIRLAAEWDEDWKVLISTILSAQTKDETTIDVCNVLFKEYSSIEGLAKAKFSSVRKVIHRINYNKTKARNIIKTAKIISKNGIPKDIDGLLELPGVGRKVASVYLAEACKEDAIGVDTHVGRISYKLKWTKNKNPHKIEKDLEKLFPREHWRSINYIIVRFGRIYGTSRKNEDEILRKIKKENNRI